MTLGRWRVPVRRPWVRTADDEHALPVSSYEYFADRDPLTQAVIDRMLAGVSTPQVRSGRRTGRRGGRGCQHLNLKVDGLGAAYREDPAPLRPVPTTRPTAHPSTSHNPPPGSASALPSDPMPYVALGAAGCHLQSGVERFNRQIEHTPRAEHRNRYMMLWEWSGRSRLSHF